MECVEVVESLSQKEKNTILSVLQRDEKLRDEQEQKIKKLKTEIAALRCNAVLRAGDDQTKICLRCRQEFGFLFNRGALCPTCKYKVCKNCQEYLFNGSWLCALCYRQRQLKWLSGEWATFQQNPLRKWASGSDILRASMSLSATTIDIDNEPEPSLPPAQSKNNQRGRKPAHNGVSSQNKQDSKTRVEYPKENDQLKLSQLFDVLRPKKPTEEGPIETQVMRVSTRRYSESDSDSSSSSDLVLDTNSHRSSPNAPSVTESEFDARIHSPVSLSPSQSSVESPRSVDHARQMAPDKGDRPTRPIPAPRSPKPAVRTKIKETQAVVRPKTRNVVESQVPEKSILKLGDESKVAMSRSVDINLGADLNAETEYKRRAVSHNELNLQLHVNKTKESLDKKSRSHNTLAAAETSQEQKRSSDSELWKGQKEYSKQKGDGLIERNLQRPVSSDIITATTRGQPEKVKRKQKRNDAQSELKHEEHINARQNQAAESKPGKRQDTKGDKSREIKHEYVDVHIDSMPEADQVTIESVQKGEKGNNTDNHHDVSDRISVSSKASRTSADHETGGVGGHSKVSSDEDFQFTIPLPRTGSPYSFSMDSLPSSHPSPTLRQRTHDLSLVESSDTDSLSRFSQPELSEHSGTESLKSKNSEEDFDVEVLSKVRFQRVSKKVGQMGIMSKIKSPKRNVTADIGLPAMETQSSRDVEEVCRDSGKKTVTNSDDDYDYEHDENENRIQDGRKDAIPNYYTGSMSKLQEGVDEFFLSSKPADSESEDEQVLTEDILVEQAQRPHSSQIDDFMARLQMLVKERKDSERSLEMSWIEESALRSDKAYTQEEIDAAREDWLKQRIEGRYERRASDRNVKPSETDSIELMIDEMIKPEQIGETMHLKPRAESDLTTDVNLTPITPLSAFSEFDYDIPTNVQERYRFSYMSSEFDSADDVIDDEDETAEDVRMAYLSKESEKIMDYGKEDGNFATEVPRKMPLRAMGSLDLLVDQQGDLIEDSMEDVHLDAEFQDVLKVAAAETSIAMEEMIKKTDNLLQVHESVETKEDYLSKSSDEEDEKPNREFDFRQLVDRFSPRAEKDDAEQERFNFKRKVDLAEEIRKNLEAEAAFKEKSKPKPTMKMQGPPQNDVLSENLHDNKSLTCNVLGHTKLSQDCKSDHDESEKNMKCKLRSSLDELVFEQGRYLKEDEMSKSVDLSEEFQSANAEGTDSFLSVDELGIPKESFVVEEAMTKMTQKRKLEAASSLDRLIQDQGEFITEAEFGASVDITPELVAAMEQKFRADVKLDEIKNDAIAQSQVAVGSKGPKPEMFEVVVVNNNREDGQVSTEGQQLYIEYIPPEEVDFTPIGFVERVFNYDSNDSDALSVITEEDELSDSTDEEGIYADEKNLATELTYSDKNANCVNKTAVGSYEKTVQKEDQKVKLYVKAHEQKKTGSTAKVGAAKLISNKAANSNKIKTVHDHWIAVEKHEADILDLEEDELKTTKADDCHVKVANQNSHENDIAKVKVANQNSHENDIAKKVPSALAESCMIEKTSNVSESNKHRDGNEVRTSETNIPVFIVTDTDFQEKSDNKHFQKLNEQIPMDYKESDDIIDVEKLPKMISEEEDSSKCEQSNEIQESPVSLRVNKGRFDINDSAICHSISDMGSFTVDPSFVEEGMEKDEMFGVHKSVMKCRSIGELQSISTADDSMLNMSVDKCYSISDGEASCFYKTYDDEEECISIDESLLKDISGTAVALSDDKIEAMLHSQIAGAEVNLGLSNHEDGEEMLGTQASFRQSNIIVDIDSSSLKPSHVFLSPDEKMLGTRESLRQCNSIGDIEPSSLLSVTSSAMCHSLAEGDQELFYNVQDEDEQCNSIDEFADFGKQKAKYAKEEKVRKLLESSSFEDVPEGSSSGSGSKEKDNGKKKANGLEKNETKPIQHKPLKRLHDNKPVDELALEIMMLGPLVKPKADSLVSSQSSTISSQTSNTSIPPIASDSADAHTADSLAGLRPECAEPLPGIADLPQEKLAGVQEVPQPMSEGSTISQDDSGHVSGGSSGTTPEHKRQDSNFSSSSIPSTLSTVTDRSEEEEDIDKVITNMKLQNAGSRGNLLTVIADSRESICSFYSDAGDVAYNTVPITGEVLFGVNYNYKTSMLEVAVKQCKDIAIADTKKNKSDPYVKTYLLPDKTRSGKRKTKVKKHSTSPVFEETLRYSISKSELENRSLWLTVWHNDRFGRNVFLGEVSINFDYYKFDNPTPRWYPLQERNVYKTENQPASMMTYKGDLSISLKYVSPDKVNTTTTTAKGKQKKDGGKGQLHVKVKEARNLTAVRSNGFSDPFCKGYLLPERHKSSKQKTPVLKKNCNPTWNHTFIFEDISLMELRERCLELTIWDYDKLSSNDFLGGVRLNLGTGMSQGKSVDWMDARGEEMSIWQAMLDRPNIWIEGALILRPNMEKRKY